ncbi:MAG: hypothetical protein ACR2QV_16370 [Gammaproteobacteria bacterium]
MGPELYYWYAGVQTLICAWALWLWRVKRAPGATLIALASAMLAYESAVIGVGHLIGQGQTLETLNLFRYGIFLTTGPLTALAALRISLAANIRSISTGPGRMICRATITLLLAYGLYVAVGGFALEPACLDGTLRYAARVPETQFCSADQVTSNSTSVPISLIVSDILVAIIGATLWGKRSWPWLFVASIAVFAASKFPYDQFGQSISNASALLWMLAFAATSARFASLPDDNANTFTSTMSFATRSPRSQDL